MVTQEPICAGDEFQMDGAVAEQHEPLKIPPNFSDAPFERFGTRLGVVIDRRRQRGRQLDGLAVGKPGCGNAPVITSRRIYAIDTAAELGNVDVVFEYALLAQASFHGNGQDQLVPFAQGVARGTQKNIFHGLLGDRARTINETFLGKIVFHGFLECIDIHTLVRIKVGILGND